MPDLFAWLTAKYVEEHRAGVSPADSDAALQWMELQLEGGNETGEGAERYILEAYLSLLNDELQALPVGVHEWFLERWAIAGPGTDNPEQIARIADRIAAMYLMAGPGTYQAAAVASLLTFDRYGERRPSHVVRIWDLVTRNVSDDLRRVLIEPLVEALLDLVYMTAEPSPVLAALGDIVRRDVERRYAVPLVRERIEIVGDPEARPLTQLLSDLHG